MMSSTSHRDHWAQIGPYKDGVNTGRWDLWQCANGNGAPTNELWSGHSVGSRPTYKVVYGAGGDKYFYVNGTSKSSCSYTFSPDAAIVESEIHNKGTQVPGHVSDHEGFVNAQGQGSGGSMHDLFDGASVFVWGVPGGGLLPSWFHVLNVSTTHEQTWDGDCS